MPSAQYKVIFFINHPRGGWSETYYTYQPDILSATNQAVSLGKKRSKLLADPSTLVAYRVGEEGNPRNTLLNEVDWPRFSETDSQSDTPWQAVLIRMAATGTGYKRPLYLRGIPDNYYDTNNPDNAVATSWKNYLNNTFRPSLLDGNWYIKGRAKPPSGVKVPILNWEPGNSEHSTIITQAAPITLAPGDKIQVYKLIGFPQAPGLCAVTFAVAPAIDFKIQLHTPSDFIYKGQAYYIKYAPAYSLIDQTNLGSVVHRDVGRPFGLERGRRRAIRR